MGFSKSFVTSRPSAHLWRVPLNLSPYHSYIARPRALSSSVQLILFQYLQKRMPSHHNPISAWLSCCTQPAHSAFICGSTFSLLPLHQR